MSAGHSSTTAIVILAAGMSRRMGADNKLLLCAGQQDTPMVRTVAMEALNSDASAVYVVLGYQADQVQRTLADLPVNLLSNPDFTSGLSASVRVAINRIGTQHDSLIITLADMPFVNTDLYDQLIDTFQHSNRQSIVAPRFNQKRGNPVLWPQCFFPELSQLSGDKGGRQLLQQHADALLLVDVNDPSVCLDIDTHEQLKHSHQHL